MYEDAFHVKILLGKLVLNSSVNILIISIHISNTKVKLA